MVLTARKGSGWETFRCTEKFIRMDQTHLRCCRVSSGRSFRKGLGYILGGGVGWINRSLGASSSSLLSRVLKRYDRLMKTILRNFFPPPNNSNGSYRVMPEGVLTTSTAAMRANLVLTKTYKHASLPHSTAHSGISSKNSFYSLLR